MDMGKKYSNTPLQTNGLFGAFVANTSTEIKLIGMNQTFLQPDNNFKPHQTQRRDLRIQGYLLLSTALGVEDRVELFRERSKSSFGQERKLRMIIHRGIILATNGI